MPDEPEQITRRRFLFDLSWRAIGALTLVEGGAIGLRFVASRKTDSMFGEVITAGRPKEFEPGTITPFEEAHFFLVRFYDGGFLALYSRCTHLACVVNWDETTGQFLCPCHGSQFEMSGDVVNPPAPRPLDRFSITLERSRIQVDTSQIIRRSAIEADTLFYVTED